LGLNTSLIFITFRKIYGLRTNFHLLNYIWAKKNSCWLLRELIPGTAGGVSEWVHQYVQAFDDTIFHILQVATDQYLNATIDDALYSVPGHVESFTRIPPPDLTNDWRTESQHWKQNVWEDVVPVASNTDLIHIANTGFAGWLGKEVAEATQKPLLLTEHALYWKEIDMGAVALECGYKVPNEEHSKQNFVSMFDSMAREIYSASNIVISVSECNIPEQRKRGATDIQYIPNGIPKEWLQSSHRSDSKKITVGWVGRCAEMKNPLKFFDVIEAFTTISEQEVQFVMLACDANEPELAASVKERSRDYPQLDLVWNRSAEEYIDRLDALCITSHNESQPLVLFEALARNVLPIGWQAGDVSEKYGLIVDRETSVETLVEQILELWQQPERWKGMVQSRHKLVVKHHTWENIFEEYRAILNKLIKSTETYVG